MHVVLGGNGHVGSAVADALLSRGEPVTIVTHDARGAAAWLAKGARVAQADIGDVDALRAALRTGRRAFLLNPPANPSLDTDAVERQTIAHILAALRGSGLEKVVAASTMGARPASASAIWGRSGNWSRGCRDSRYRSRSIARATT